MRKIKQVLLASLITGLLGTPISRAEVKTSPSCDQVLSLCDKAVNDLEKRVQVKDLVIVELSKQNSLLQQQYDNAKAAGDSWYHNPFVLTALGFAFGVMGGVWVRK